MIVGIGASAGGLDAFTRLLRELPSDTGLAYVIVQHLSPDHESMLPELLGRAARIPITQAVDGLAVERDHAYVIPPNTTMRLADGHLTLATRPAGGGTHFSIDTFLSSLAEVHGAQTMAVILSGAGSDGARGAEAIKAEGGIVFAQDAASARYPSMPDAAIATGCVDFILPPEQIAVRLAEIGRRAASAATLPDATAPSDEEAISSVLHLLHRRTGVDFSRYRRATIERRISRRMILHGHNGHADYVALLGSEPGEADALYQDLLIGVTSFFRDPDVFAELRRIGLPTVMRARHVETPFRIWVAGCSGGEEAYSLAIETTEFLHETGSDIPLQVFGTDLNDAAIARARAGVYPESIAEHMSAARLERYFTREDDKYRIAKSIRDLCIFSRQNLLRDPPFSHLDLVSCRNVLIYMEPALQARLFPIFHYALEPHGLLLLGTAESPTSTPELFEPLSKRHRLFQRSPGPARVPEFGFDTPAAVKSPGQGRPTDAVQMAPAATRRTTAGELATTIDRLVLSHHGSDGVVVNERMEIVHFRGDTSAFLAQAPGAPTMDLLQLVRPELSTRLRAALHHVVTKGTSAKELNIPIGDDGRRQVTIEVLPLDTLAGRLLAVLFTHETSAPNGPEPRGRWRGESARSKQQLRSLEAELLSTKTHLVELVDQHRATVEELRAAGEEIQSANEELQSTNEELETTKEEIQSTNEELTTLNEELRHRNRELGELASDLANVFASTQIPIVIVGADLRLRRFTPVTTRVLNVIPTDVGRPLGDVKLRFEMPDLEERVTTTIASLVVTDQTVQSSDGAWWTLTIRPYQTVDRRVDGAVLVFSDIDAAKRSETRAVQTSESQQRALASSEEARGAALSRTNELLAANLAERERAETDRNALLRRLSSAHEDERRRLSRELHDEAGQSLTAIGLGLQSLVDREMADPEMGGRVANLRELVETLSRELHDIALRLRPKALDDFGLDRAIAGLVSEWSRRTGIVADFHATLGAERLPAEIESTTYRIVQEALTNIAKHSEATRASIVIERRDGSLHAIVEDNGKGLANESNVDGGNGHLGIIGMRERAAQLGGRMEIEAADGQGTTIFVRIPIGSHR